VWEHHTEKDVVHRIYDGHHNRVEVVESEQFRVSRSGPSEESIAVFTSTHILVSLGVVFLGLMCACTKL
jgi:hypothetical protein